MRPLFVPTIPVIVCSLACGSSAPPPPEPDPVPVPIAPPPPPQPIAAPPPAPRKVPGVDALPPELADFPRRWLEIKEIDGVTHRVDDWCDASAASCQLLEHPAALACAWGQDGDRFLIFEASAKEDGIVVGDAISFEWTDRSAGVGVWHVPDVRPRPMMDDQHAAALPGWKEPGCVR
ncbi:MAG: hypothetical protein KC621_31675 [Myxococcales bacterium]|nr:hypothetical protein [Myxococcales bacterium]